MEFVDVADIDGENLIRERSVGRPCPHGDVVGSGSFAVDRTGNRHHAGGGIDGKAAAGVVGQRVGDGVIGGIRIDGRGSQSNGCLLYTSRCV